MESLNYKNIMNEYAKDVHWVRKLRDHLEEALQSQKKSWIIFILMAMVL